MIVDYIEKRNALNPEQEIKRNGQILDKFDEKAAKASN